MRGPITQAGPGPIPPLSSADLEGVGSFIYERTGMVFGESKRYYIDRRISDLMTASGAVTAKAYLLLLKSDEREVERLINSFTVNETYFFREEHQLACLSRSLLPEIIRSKGPGDRIRIWSMPCASGEEPYSIAIWLLENWNLVDAYNIEIVGSDIDTDVLKQAREAIYGERSLSRLSAGIISQYFEPLGGLKYRLIKDLRESVVFTKANLMDGGSLSSLGRFDVIFCRNLLIYFDEAARTKAADNLHDLLTPGGYICLGHTESMGRISERFEAVRFPDAIVYRSGGEG